MSNRIENFCHVENLIGTHSYRVQPYFVYVSFYVLVYKKVENRRTDLPVTQIYSFYIFTKMEILMFILISNLYFLILFMFLLFKKKYV